MPRSLLLLPLILVPVTPLASGGRQPPEKANPDPKRSTEPGGLTPPARPGEPPAGYHHVKLNGHTFTLPVGFTIELAAGPPQVERPIVAAFDEKGRLYVCDSSGSNEKVAEQVVKKPHRIVRLEDTDGDGRYEKSTLYVPNVMLPEGAMWLNGSLYVAAPPHIWKFTDTDDDGKADKQDIWFDGKTLTGCANDLHGPYLGPDGWVYWCKGAFAKQEYTLPNGKPFSTRASHIFRARPDGSGIEPVMTGGMDNPVDVTFAPTGDRILSNTFFQHPADGKRDGLIHAVYGGVYGKDHDPVHEHVWTSPQLMPVLTHVGPAAPCGLHRYESDQFGKEYENNVFCCQFNMRKVSRHVLVPSGATYTTTDSDFVVSDHRDFHPTDVIEDADGSLLIIDTGGWYKLCCPTSQLVKPDVTGAIYRVKKTGAHKVEDPRGATIDWAEPTGDLTVHLEDPRPAVRQKATEVIAARGDPAAERLAQLAPNLNVSERRRLGAVWTLARINSPAARKAVRYSCDDSDEVTRLAALHIVGLWRDRDAVADLAKLLKHPSAPTRRAAAEALGRSGSTGAVPPLLTALSDETNDRVLDHSLAYSLVEIGDPQETAQGLTHPSPRVRRAVLIALDQMPNGKLDAKLVLAELDAKDAAMKDTAWWIAGRHPDWGDQLAGCFREQLKRADKLPPAGQEELAARLAKFAKSEAIQQALGEAVGGAGSRRVASLAMARSGLRALPEVWRTALLRLVPKADDATLKDVLAVYRGVPVTGADYDKLVQSFGDTIFTERMADEQTLGVLGVAPPGHIKLNDSLRDYLLRMIDVSSPPAVRAAAADVLVRAKMVDDDLLAIVIALGRMKPMEVQRILPVFERSKSVTVGSTLVDALMEDDIRRLIRVEQVKPILDKYPKPVRDAAEKLYALLAEARKDELARLERLATELPGGDIRRGQAVFNGAKAQCAACHKIGYVGGLVGPDLTRIGGIRTERDLLESIVFPSASFVRSYEPVRVVTADGRTLSGILKKDAPDEIVLVIAADKEERIARADVESVSPSTVSVMPAGLDQQLTRQELADLVAFLRACK